MYAPNILPTSDIIIIRVAPLSSQYLWKSLALKPCSDPLYIRLLKNLFGIIYNSFDNKCLSFNIYDSSEKLINIKSSINFYLSVFGNLI